jgi:hypothetical protein
LTKLFNDIVKIDLNEIKRDGASTSLLVEAHDVQKTRNMIIHQGVLCKESESVLAMEIATLILERIVAKMFDALGLGVLGNGSIKPI